MKNPLVKDAIVFGDRQKYLVALVTLAEAPEDGSPLPEVAKATEDAIAATIDELNQTVGRVFQIKKHAVLHRGLSQAKGELTPTLKLKRQIIASNFGAILDELYGSDALFKSA